MTLSWRGVGKGRDDTKVSKESLPSEKNKQCTSNVLANDRIEIILQVHAWFCFALL